MTDSIDIVFVSNCAIESMGSLWEMTANAVRSAVKNAGMPVGRVFIIEQCRLAKKQPIGYTVHYDFEFNYNKCLNLGLYLSEQSNDSNFVPSKYIAFCNNDLYFENNWAWFAVDAMITGGYLSASPTNRHTFKGVKEGYTIGKVLLGWCIITDRKVFDYIGQFDEPVTFWYSDNVYAEQLKLAGVKHILVGNSRVKHLGQGSITLKKISTKLRVKYQKSQEKLFVEYKKKKYANPNIKVQAESESNSGK